MPSYPTVPDVPRRNAPSAGPDAGAAAIAAIAPALGMIPGPVGKIGGVLGSALSGWLDYQTAREATQRENEDRMRAEAMLEDYRPYVERPAEYNFDPRVPYIAQAVRIKDAADANSRRAVEDTLSRYGSGAYGQIPDAQLQEIARSVQRAADRDTGMTLAELWERAEQQYIRNRLAIGNAELQRGSANEQLAGDRLRMLLGVLTGDYGVINTSGVADRVTDHLRFMQQLDLQQQALDDAERANERSLYGALGGSLINAGATLGGAGITSSALKSMTPIAKMTPDMYAGSDVRGAVPTGNRFA